MPSLSERSRRRNPGSDEVPIIDLATAKRFNMGQLSFYVAEIKCSKCDFDFASDEQMIYEWYLNMVEQSKTQHEPQLDKYNDWFKQMIMCPKCNRPLIARVKFTKIHNFIQVEAATYPIEKDVVWIATHRPKFVDRFKNIEGVTSVIYNNKTKCNLQQ